MSGEDSTTSIISSQKRKVSRRRLRGPNKSKPGNGIYKVSRHTLQPGVVTRREWLRFLSYGVLGDMCLCTPSHPHRHWIWIGSCNKYNYGHFFWRGHLYLAHRFAYVALGGIIPDGYEGDHLCRVTQCFQPLCLDPVPKSENQRRGMGICAKNSRKTHCNHGHPLKGDNLYIPELVKGVRRCLVCLEKKRHTQDMKRKALIAARPPKAPRTHCRNGHMLTDENILAYELRTFGQRICRLCVRQNERARRII